MSQPRVEEVDFYILMEKFKRARDVQGLIERRDKELWQKYVEDNKVRETALEAFGKVRFAMGKPKLAAINIGSDWDGCYVYSIEDENALKYVPGV